MEFAGERANKLYGLDRVSTLRFSHENPSIIKVYDEYLEHPLSHRAHELLHTDHTAWDMPMAPIMDQEEEEDNYS